jgi:hypothetical protein
VTAEVVVVVEDQDLRVGLDSLAVEIGRRQSTESTPDYDQVVFGVVVGDWTVVVQSKTISQQVSGVERALMISSETGECRRIIAGVWRFAQCAVGGRDLRVAGRSRFGRRRELLLALAAAREDPRARGGGSA